MLPLGSSWDWTFQILSEKLAQRKDYSGLITGFKLHAEADGKYWAAEATWWI